MTVRVLHLLTRSHVTEGFLDFLTGLDWIDAEHVVLPPSRTTGWIETKGVTVESVSNRLLWFLTYCRLARRADRIFVHGLGRRVTVSLALSPWTLCKCYWLIWGADLYAYRHRNRSMISRIMEPVRRFVIRRIGHLVTYLEEDVNLARKWYGALGIAHNCLLYAGNTVQHGVPSVTAPPQEVRVQVGNSADPENCHLEVFEALAELGNSFRVFAPLSYGDPAYRELVAEAGDRLFGERFVPLRKLLTPNDYQSYLRSIDIAVFNHRRQQAMGNTISLLAAGKRVFIRRHTAQWALFESLGIEVSAVEDGIDIGMLPDDARASNVRLTAENFSRKKLAQQWVDMIAGSDLEKDRNSQDHPLPA